ncbi:MAG: site-specific DNA-methyltransferase [Bacteroidetes bacterium]|nr:site-specific DNA-methyltransferase [Bacteroidota bacterium]
MNKTQHKVIFGDSRSMKELGSESVHLIITSPPYWQLKDYGHTKQIGFDDSYEDYINNLNLVWMECERVLHKGCRLCINIGDQFARSVYYGRYKVIPIRTEIIRFCETIGFDYMGAIIWQKVTTSNTTGGAAVMGSYPYPRNGIIKIDYEFILIFKKLGDSPKPTAEQKKFSTLSNDEWNQYFSGHWNFPGERQNGGHIAMFPVELPYRLIRMFSFPGEYVLDPFYGSGTTTLASMQLGRNSVGYEINKKFTPFIEKRLGLDQEKLFTQKFEIEFQTQSTAQIDKARLPFIFKDPIRFNKKIDPRSLNFGSKITGKEENGVNLFVKEILSPNKVRLNSGQLVRLIGVKPNPAKELEAMDFLRNVTKGNPILLRFDEKKFDNNNNLLVYLFLKNKTFVNAHLIKKNLVDVESSMDFKYKNKFEKIASGIS